MAKTPAKPRRTSVPAPATAGPGLCLFAAADNGPLPAAALAALFARLAPGRAVTCPEGPPALPADGGQAVVLVQDPAAALAWRIVQGAAPARALAEWMAWAGGVLGLHRRARRRVTLFDPQGLAGAQAAGVRQRLAARLGLPAQDWPEPEPEPEAAPLPPLALLVAQGLLAAGAPAALAEELGAATIGSAWPAGDPGLADRAWSGWTAAAAETALLREHLALRAPELAAGEAAQRELGELRTRLVDQLVLAATNAALERRLETAQHEAARREAILAGQILGDAQRPQAEAPAPDLRPQVARLEAALAAALAQAAALAAQVEAAARREAILAGQVLGDAGRLEAAARREAILAGQVLDDARLQPALDETEGRLAAMESSRSWRATAGLRAIRRHLGSG